MAVDKRLTLSNESKVVYLAASNSDTSTRLSDQNTTKLGTNRKTEMEGIIGDDGKSFEELYNTYLLTL